MRQKSIGVPYVLDIIGGKVIGEGVTYPSTLPQAIFEASTAASYKGRTQIVAWLRVMVPGGDPKVEIVAVFEDDGAILSDSDAVVQGMPIAIGFFDDEPTDDANEEA